MPPAFTWLKIMAWINLCLGMLLVCGLLVGLAKSGMGLSAMDHKGWILVGFYLVVFVVIPISVLMRLKIGFYMGLLVTFPMLLGFPLGTILAILTIKAFFDAREAFGVR